MRVESEATNSMVPDETIPTEPSDAARTKIDGVGVLVGLVPEDEGPTDGEAGIDAPGPDGLALVGRSVGLTPPVLPFPGT